MTRRKLVIFFAAALAILYAYEILVAVGGESNRLHFVGLALALALLVVEIRAAMIDRRD
jgi:multidrug efflux pump subunit AcrB